VDGLAPETDEPFTADLHRYLRAGRRALLWKLEGLRDYDVRRPLVPTGNNLLGLVKHLACVEAGYFGVAFGRPFPETLPWDDDDPNADMFATADETRDDVLTFYDRACTHADATIQGVALTTVGTVPWWPPEADELTLHRALIHVAAETHRHLGHADILRELVDGAVGHGPERDVLWLPDDDWQSHHRRVQEIAERFQ